MNAAANVTTQKDLDALKRTLALFFAERAQKAIDKMWDEGIITDETIKQWGSEHMRTPYRTNYTVSSHN